LVHVQNKIGRLLYYPGSRRTPTPFKANFTLSPLYAWFDFNMLNYTFNGAATGDYEWYSVLINVGGNPLNCVLEKYTIHPYIV